MKIILRNSFAVIIGLFVGSLANMGLIMIGATVVPAPAGVDATTMEGLKAGMHLFGFKHFIFPFLAHAVGTLVGAFIAFKIGISQQCKLAMTVGVFFLAGGIANIIMLPSPLWFTIVDVVCAYIPMAWLGWKFAKRK